MKKKSTNRYTPYFISGVKFNFLNVIVSLILSFATAFIYFNNLSKSDFIFYSVSQITIYFFVSFSNLQFGKLIRKYFPNYEKDISDIILKKLIKTSIYTLFTIFVFYFFITKYFEIYSYFEEYLNIFYLFIFISSLVTILSNYFGEYLAANQKFDIQEKKYLVYSAPFKFIGLLLFYFVFKSLFFVLLINILIRVINMIITYKVSNTNLRNKSHNLPSQEVLNLFKTKSNILFTAKNFIFFNYPLLFFSYMPVYLTDFHTENDIAVFSLAISLFNSIRPFLNGVLVIINPAIQQLNKQNDNEKLFKIIYLVFLSLNFLTIYLMILIWSGLNFSPIVTILFTKFSYNLFSDLALSAIILSLFFMFNQIKYSYLLSINKENVVFVSSLLSVIISLYCWSQYQNFGSRINLSLLIIFIFYFFNLSFNVISVPVLLGKYKFTIFGVVIVYLFSLNTFFFDSFVVFLLINFLNILILISSLRGLFKKLGIKPREIITS